MTVYETDIGERIAGAKQIENLEFSYEKKDTTLLCTVAGKIDTISPPALLEVFEKKLR